MRPVIALALATLTLSTGCRSSVWTASIEGVGPHLPEARAVETFDAVSLEGSWTVDVKVGEATSVVVHADENLHPYIASEVEDGRLRLRFLESVSSSNGFRAEITTPSLRNVSVSGSGRLNVTGVDAQDFVVSIAGSGRGTIEGRTEGLDVSIAGSGDLELFGLEAEDVHIRISGSGSVDTHATQRLDVSISGSGRVHYRGRPELSVRQSGSGRVSAVD